MDLNELFQHFEGLVKELSDKVDASNKRMDDILQLYHDEEDRWNDEQDSNAWKDSFEKDFEPYRNAYSIFNTEDVLDDARKEYNSRFKDKMSKEEFVAKVIPNLQKKMDELRDALGAKSVTVTSEGEKSDEPAEETIVTEGETKEESAEENVAASNSDEIEKVKDEIKEEEEFDVDSFEKELQEYKDSHNL